MSAGLHVLVIAAIALIVVWIGRLLHPNGPCLACGGTGQNIGSNGERWGICGTCGGTKQRRRFGATIANRAFWALRGRKARDRHQKRLQRARQRAGHPNP